MPHSRLGDETNLGQAGEGIGVRTRRQAQAGPLSIGNAVMALMNRQNGRGVAHCLTGGGAKNPIHHKPQKGAQRPHHKEASAAPRPNHKRSAASEPKASQAQRRRREPLSSDQAAKRSEAAQGSTESLTLGMESLGYALLWNRFCSTVCCETVRNCERSRTFQKAHPLSSLAWFAQEPASSGPSNRP